MFAVFLLIAGVVIGAGISGAYFAPRKSFLLRLAGALAALSLLIATGALFWKHIILAVAIGSLVALAVGVMLQRADPGKAMLGALCAFVLLFVFSWLAVELADVFLFGNGSEVLEKIGQFNGSFTGFMEGIWDSHFRNPTRLDAIDAVWIAINSFLLDLHPILRFVLVILAIVTFLRVLLSINNGSRKRGENP